MRSNGIYTINRETMRFKPWFHTLWNVKILWIFHNAETMVAVNGGYYMYMVQTIEN